MDEGAGTGGRRGSSETLKPALSPEGRPENIQHQRDETNKTESDAALEVAHGFAQVGRWPGDARTQRSPKNGRPRLTTAAGPVCSLFLFRRSGSSFFTVDHALFFSGNGGGFVLLLVLVLLF